jgi:polygalacturonase
MVMSRIFGDIRFIRGLDATIPVFAEGQPAITTDTKRVFVGSADGNVEIAKQETVEVISNQLINKATVLQQDTLPEDAQEGDFWLDTSDDAYQGTVFEDLSNQLAEKVKKGDISFNVKDYGATGLGSIADQSAIQTVLDMAKTKGSVHCVIPDGVYWVTNRLTIYKNTRIQMGKNTVLLRKWAGGFFANGVSGDSFTGYTGNGNILVEGGTLDGNWAQYNTSGTYYGFDAIGLARGENIIFRNVTILDVVGAHAFDINACKNVLIDGCIFKGYNTSFAAWGDDISNFREAIQLSNHTQAGYSLFGSWNGDPTVNVVVRNCYFGASNNLPAWPTGVGNHGAVQDTYNSNIIVDGNTFDGLVYAGVRNFKFRDTIVVNNEFLNCAYGVVFSNVAPGTESSKYGDGTQSNLPQNGDGYIISNNIFRGTTKNNVFINGQVTATVTTKVKNITITNNQFINQSKTAYDNIYIHWADSVRFANNIVNGCYRGFNILYSSNVSIEHNHIEDCLYEGIWVQEDSTEASGAFLDLGYTSNINVRFNKVDKTGRNAIIVQHTDDFEIVGNKISNAATETDNLRDGINCSSNAKNGRVYHNKVRMAATGNQNKYGVDVTSSCSNVQTFNNDADGKTAKQVNASVGGFEGSYFHSADGTRYKVSVANGGTISIVAG